MAIYLIRHGHAGHRSSWMGDDFDRPLSAKGAHQAERLRDGLVGADLTHVYSSPSLRCIQTMEPLAAHFAVEVITAKELLEGTDAESATRFLLDHAGERAALCSHGDVIPKIIRRLISGGMRTKDANGSSKGSAWMLEVEDGAITTGRYIPPIG